MDLEVELKFRVGDSERVREALQRLGGRPQERVEQTDTYFAHPTRDFVATDEALRIRCVGDTGRVTYKGPLVDRDTKSREEMELAFQGGAEDAQRFAQILERLGFSSVREVRKTRHRWSLRWQERDFEIAFDDVPGLGTFIELETVSTQLGFPVARQAILALATTLDLHDMERRSYLSMLLARDNPSG